MTHIYPIFSLSRTNLVNCDILRIIWQDFKNLQSLKVLILNNYIILQKIYARFDAIKDLK